QRRFMQPTLRSCRQALRSRLLCCGHVAPVATFSGVRRGTSGVTVLVKRRSPEGETPMTTTLVCGPGASAAELRGTRRAAAQLRARAAALAALLACLPALAQQQTAAEQPAAGVEEVVVTGSRIAAPNQTSTSPIQVISAQSIQTTGKTDISDVITQLPQNFNNSLGQDLGNGTSGLTTAGGVATADLRGLGPNRTLVLVDGRRLGQGSPYTAIQSPAPDLDQIPSGLVDRVEVVTRGASPPYL